MAKAKNAERRASRETEQAFIDAATELFAEKGYHGTSINDLARHLGLTTASLYYYVDGKQDLLHRVLEASVHHFLSGLESIAASDLAPRDKLVEAAANHVDFVLDNPTAVAVFLRERRFLPAEQQAELAARVNLYDQMFTDMVRAAIDDGTITPGDPKLLRLFALGSVNWLVEWYRPDGALSRSELRDQLLAFILERVFGMAPAPAAPPTAD